MTYARIVGALSALSVIVVLLLLIAQHDRQAYPGPTVTPTTYNAPAGEF